MARSMWRGAIQFGLVTIPIKLYLATEQGGIGFNLLHATCLNRIQMKVYCPHHDEVIPRSETVRGYEWSKGKYVVVGEEDIDSVPLKTVRAIEIEMFVKASRVAVMNISISMARTVFSGTESMSSSVTTTYLPLLYS